MPKNNFWLLISISTKMLLMCVAIVFQDKYYALVSRSKAYTCAVKAEWNCRWASGSSPRPCCVQRFVSALWLHVESYPGILEGANSKMFYVFSGPWEYAGALVCRVEENGRGVPP